MTNRKNWLGILVITLVFLITVIGCDEDSTDDGGGGGVVVQPSPLNGTWGNAELNVAFTFNNGNFETKENSSGVPLKKGTYTYIDNSLTLAYTHVYNTGKWYTKAELIVLVNIHDDNFFDQIFAPQTVTCSVSGNTLNLGGLILTKK